MHKSLTSIYANLLLHHPLNSKFVLDFDEKSLYSIGHSDSSFHLKHLLEGCERSGRLNSEVTWQYCALMCALLNRLRQTKRPVSSLQQYSQPPASSYMT